jgi:hypothetical protein
MPACSAALFAALLAPAAAPPDDERRALALVPADAPLVIHLRGPEGARARAVELLKKALPDAFPLIEKEIPPLDNLGGRKLTGLRKDGPLFLAVLKVPRLDLEDAPSALVAAVTDYAAFRDGLLTAEERKGLKVERPGLESANRAGEKTWFLQHKGLAVVSTSRGAVEAAARGRPGLGSRLTRAQAALLLRGDVSAYLDLAALNRAFAKELREARDEFEKGVKAGAKGLEGKPGRTTIDLLLRSTGLFFQAVADGKTLIVTAEARPGGARVRAEYEPRPGSATSLALAGARRAAFPDLARLPAGSIYYTASTPGPDFLRFVGPLLFGVVAAPDSKEDRAARAALEKLCKAGPLARVDCWTQPPEGVQAWAFAEPDRAVAALLELMRSLDRGVMYQPGMLAKRPTVRTKAARHAGFELHHVELAFDLEKTAEAVAPGPLADEARRQVRLAMEKLVGASCGCWFGTDGKTVVLVHARDWPAARALLDRYLKATRAVGALTTFQEVRRELPSQASLLVLFDLSRYLHLILGPFRPLPLPWGGTAPAGYPARPEAGTFVGLAVNLSARAVEVDLFVPITAARQFNTTFVKPLLGK